MYAIRNGFSKRWWNRVSGLTESIEDATQLSTIEEVLSEYAEQYYRIGTPEIVRLIPKTSYDFVVVQ